MRKAMKKTAAGILAAMMVLAFGATTALAGGHGCRRNYTDANGDGICDYAVTGCRYTDADGDGVCDYAGTRCRHTDADGDGICDYCGSMQGQGTGKCQGHRHGCSR